MPKTILSDLLIYLLIYFAVIALLFLSQRSYIYFPDKTKPILAAWGAADMQQVQLKTEDQLLLTAWFKPAARPLPTLIYFQGNASHWAARVPIVRSYLDDGYGVLLVGYRGYGGNPGSPSEKGLYADGQAALDFVKQQGISADCIVLYGESLGTGIAVQLATKQPVAALVLQAPYTSLGDLAAHHYWYIIGSRWLVRDRFNSLAKIQQIRVPLLIIHGEQDNIVPAKFSKRLYEQAAEPKKMLLYKGLGHNDLFGVDQEVKQFLQKYVHCNRN